jgi:hypothetical protein
MDYMGYNVQFTGVYLRELKNTHSIITVENRTLVNKNIFDNQDIGDHPQ